MKNGLLDLPTGWERPRLKEITDIASGVAKGRKFNGCETVSVPYLRVANVQTGHLNLDEVREIEVLPSEVERYRLQIGDVLMTEGGDRDKLGRGTIWRGEVDCCIHQNHIFRVRPDRNRVLPEYLSLFLGTPEAKAYFLSAAKQTTGIASINLTQLSEFPVILPPVGEQFRIVSILDKADAIRRKRFEQQTCVDELIHSAFMEIVGPVAHRYSEWKPRTIESLALNRPGSMRTGPFGSDLKHSEFVDDGIAVLGIDNAVQNHFAWGERRFITPEKYEQLQRYRVCPGDVIITIMGTTGRSAVVPDDIPLSITTKHLATITLDRDQAEPEFISNAIHRHPAVLRQVRGSNRGAIMDGLNLGLIKSIELRVPPIGVQRLFTAAIQKIRQMESRIREGIDDSGHLFDSLVQRAFRGELS